MRQLADPIVQPVSERISAVLLSRLQQITIANGYQFNASSVTRLSRRTNEYQPEPLAIVFDEIDETENEELSCPGNPAAIAYNKQYRISGYGNRLDEDGQIEAPLIGVSENQIIAAIQKAVVGGDPSGWTSFGGDAMNSAMVATEDFDAPGYNGATVLLVVTYRIDEGDPFVSR